MPQHPPELGTHSSQSDPTPERLGSKLIQSSQVLEEPESGESMSGPESGFSQASSASFRLHLSWAQSMALGGPLLPRSH